MRRSAYEFSSVITIYLSSISSVGDFLASHSYGLRVSKLKSTKLSVFFVFVFTIFYE